MAEPGIVLDGVYKKFRRGELHDSLRDLIPAMARRLRPRKGAEPAKDRLATSEFWALQDLSFRVRPGDALGIIGGNGAGKSTTLKIINGILRPNQGRCTVTGRMGALIEIAAGFHPDLTGRENVFLQGLIMGMSKELITQRFDEIVEFAGMGDFIDTPVKRYSSGMNARLGFAIAAHLNPDVLIIDEVLSVGDFRFQQRAYDRVQDLIRTGIPVVVVSHQLDRIASLCTEALLLQRGQVVYSGTPSDCITRYLAGSGERPSGDADTADTADVADVLEFQSVSAVGVTDVAPGGEFHVRIHARTQWGFDPAHHSIGVRISSAQDGHIAGAATTARLGVTLPAEGEFTLDVRLALNVAPGIYAVETYGWDLELDRELAVGPLLYAHVREDPTFFGRSFLRPRISVSTRTHSYSEACD